MNLAKRVSFEIVLDRGFLLTPEEEKWLEYDEIPTKNYGKTYIDGIEKKGPSSLTFQEILTTIGQKNKVKNFNPRYSQLYFSENNEKLAVFMIERINVATAKMIKKTVELFKIENTIIIIDDHTKSISKQAQFLLDDIPALTIFESQEIQINPTRNMFVPIYEKPTLSELNQFKKERNNKIDKLVKRRVEDIIMRYYGYKQSDILREYYPEVIMPGSLIDQQLFWVQVV